MKSFLVITAILFVAVLGCERHPLVGEATPTPTPSVQPGVPTPTPEPSEEIGTTELLKVSSEVGLLIATLLLAYLAWKTAGIAKSTEDVFKDIVKTLADIQQRSQDAAVVQTMSDCIEQYQELENKLSGMSEKDAQRYFELLWNLHFAEFQFFIRRFLPDDVYGLWVWVRYKDYRADRTKLGMSEVEGWKYGKVYVQDEKFANFIDGLFSTSGLEQKDVITLVKNYPRS